VTTPPNVLTRRVFLAGVGTVYLCAFLSLWVQIDGLIGSRGILPAEAFLEYAGSRLGADRYAVLPTLLWWTPVSDGALHVFCAAGVLFSVFLLIGFLPVVSCVMLWASYLTLYTVSRTFLSFQWDILLLEMGFLAIFYAPLGAVWPRSPAWSVPPPRPATWLLRLLVFKLMFSSGVVKLTSGDPTWWNLTALAVHYETTCLPTWTGWYMHQLPMWCHRVSVVLMFFTELILPFFVFGPRRLRIVAAVGFTGLMIFIGATGNYGFFNLQALVLCLPLLDDDFLPRRRRGEPEQASVQPGVPVRRLWRWPPFVTVPLAVVITVLTLVPLVRAFRVVVDWPAPLATLDRGQQPFHLVNGYGLFARMTTQRPEIIVEGSQDGVSWLPYEFEWKPGDPRRRPGFVQPHMPRLDWRMWFAALGSADREGWFYPFCQRLLQGAPAVLGLLASNPFPDAPPRYLRATLWDYRFTSWGEGGDAWWDRSELRPYTPVLTLDEGGQLRAADLPSVRR
jgi:hypothetical protein